MAKTKTAVEPVVTADLVEATGAAEPAVPAVEPEADAPAAVALVSKVANLQVQLGDEVYRFAGHDLTVAPEVAERLLGHFLGRMGHIMRADEVAKVDGALHHVPRDERVKAWKAEGQVVFAFPERINAALFVAGEEIHFEHGKAAVSPELAERVRAHTFFAQGRIVEV